MKIYFYRKLVRTWLGGGRRPHNVQDDLTEWARSGGGGGGGYSQRPRQ